MKLILRPSIAYIRVLAGLFTNISAGYIGLVLITPLPGTSLLVVLKNFILAVVFYLLAVRLEEVS